MTKPIPPQLAAHVFKPGHKLSSGAPRKPPAEKLSERIGVTPATRARIEAMRHEGEKPGETVERALTALEREASDD